MNLSKENIRLYLKLLALIGVIFLLDIVSGFLLSILYLLPQVIFHTEIKTYNKILIITILFMTVSLIILPLPHHLFSKTIAFLGIIFLRLFFNRNKTTQEAQIKEAMVKNASEKKSSTTTEITKRMDMKLYQLNTIIHDLRSMTETPNGK